MLDMTFLNRLRLIVIHFQSAILRTLVIKSSYSCEVCEFNYTTLVVHLLRRWSFCAQSFVHVSTGYSQVDKANIDEVIYDAPVSPSDLVNMTQWELFVLH